MSIRSKSTRAAGAVILLAIAAFLHAGTHPRYGGAIRVVVPALPTTLDPFAAQTETDLLFSRLLYRTLFEYGPDGSLRSFHGTFERDEDRWILKPNAIPASSGRTIPLETFRRCIERALAQAGFPSMMARQMLRETATPVPGEAPSTEGAIEVLPDGSLVLHTAGLQPLLPHLLTRPPFFLVVDEGGEFFGTGPYKLAPPTNPGSINLTANIAGLEPYVSRLEVSAGRVSGCTLEAADSRTQSRPPMPAQAGGIPRTLLLGLNPVKPPFDDSVARRDFLGSIAAAHLKLPVDAGTTRTRCAYLPAKIATSPIVTALRAEGRPPKTRIVVRSGDLDFASLAPAFPQGTQFEILSGPEFESRLSTGNYQAFLMVYSHGFMDPALDLLEMLWLTRLSDPVVLDVNNRLAEATRMEDRPAVLETIYSVQRSLAESGLLFPLAEITPTLLIDSRIHGFRTDLFWNPIIGDAWIGE